MRVALNLVDLRDTGRSWAETYQRPMKDVFALQSEITRAVATHLQNGVAPNEKTILDTPPTTDCKLTTYIFRRAFRRPSLPTARRSALPASTPSHSWAKR
jgi:adenylate cyclase